MVTITPKHQFEIRYTNILNFPSVIQEALAPFVPMANNVHIDRENNLRARFFLNFDNYQIIVSWDRILIVFEGDIKELALSNSIIEEPFFNLFEKIKKLSYFGNVLNCLFYTICISHTDFKKDEIIEKFISKNINQTGMNEFVSNPSDIAITLVKNIDAKQLTITYGPYLGESDLLNRNALPSSKEKLLNLDKLGLMAEIKIFEQIKSVSFTKYKEYLKHTLDYRDNLWKAL
ncbi:MAG: hypothetical protein PHT69_16085 [Bacteroidales bacterium]|nr:hypothetical protein [Bacteroidales bacterium]